MSPLLYRSSTAVMITCDAERKDGPHAQIALCPPLDEADERQARKLTTSSDAPADWV
jgi:hypothetical protein